MTTIAQYLGDKAEYLLNFKSPKIPKEHLHLPGPEVVDRLFAGSDRNNRVLGNLQRIVKQGRLGGTGYLSILPVDQGIEHSAAPVSPGTRPISTRRTSCGWPSKAAATPSLPPLGCWAPSPANTRTRFRFW